MNEDQLIDQLIREGKQRYRLDKIKDEYRAKKVVKSKRYVNDKGELK